MYSVFARISFAVDEAVGESARPETGGSTEQETETRSLSDHCFVALLWAVMLVQLWQRLWLIQLIPLLLFYLLLKKLGELSRSGCDKSNYSIMSRSFATAKPIWCATKAGSFHASVHRH